MSAVFQNPSKVALTTALQDLTAAVPANKVATLDLRFANVGSADAYGDVVLTDGTTVINRAKNFPVPYQAAGSAPDMEQKIALTAGWKVQAKASAAGAVEASIANMVIADVADFT